MKVLKYCVKCGILQVYDGSEDSFKNDSEVDVLYLNTGVSRYFMRNFTRDATGFASPQDFFGWTGSAWIRIGESSAGRGCTGDF